MKLETRIKIASSGYFAFAAISLFALMSPEPLVREVAPFVVLASAVLGLLTFGFPVSMAFIGSVTLGRACLVVFLERLTSGAAFETPLFFGLTALMGYIFVALEQGVFAGVRLWWNRFRKAIADGQIGICA